MIEEQNELAPDDQEEILDSGALPEVEEASDPDDADQGDGDTPPTMEEIAESMGWSPQDKWRGEPDKWKPAHEFIRNTADINSKLTNRLAGMEKRLDVISRTSAQMTDQALEQQRREWESLKDEAFESGDKETFDKAEQALSTLKSKQPVDSGPSEVVQDWVTKNSDWFNKDQEATAWAINRTNELASQGLGEARQLAIVEREAKNMFPEFFQQKEKKVAPKRAAQQLNSPGKRGGSLGAKTYAALPPEAKRAADDFSARGKCTKEQYAKTYFEQMEA